MGLIKTSSCDSRYARQYNACNIRYNISPNYHGPICLCCGGTVACIHLFLDPAMEPKLVPMPLPILTHFPSVSKWVTLLDAPSLSSYSNEDSIRARVPLLLSPAQATSLSTRPSLLTFTRFKVITVARVSIR